MSTEGVDVASTRDLSAFDAPPGPHWGAAQYVPDDGFDRLASDPHLRSFIDMAVHELKTPLATISIVAEILRRGAGKLSEEETQEALDTLARQTERSATLMNDLVNLFRIGTAGSEINLVPLDAAASVEKALRRAANPSAVTVDVDIPPETYVIADAKMLQHALVNLLSNCYKHGGNNVAITSLRSLNASGITIAISDDGPGVADHLLPFLFEPFARASKSVPGSGLGLAIAHASVRSFGGTLGYQPGVPWGATFTVSLPLAAKSNDDGGGQHG